MKPRNVLDKPVKIINFWGAALRSLQDLSSLTRDRICTPGGGSVES